MQSRRIFNFYFLTNHLVYVHASPPRSGTRHHLRRGGNRGGGPADHCRSGRGGGLRLLPACQRLGNAGARSAHRPAGKSPPADGVEIGAALPPVHAAHVLSGCDSPVPRPCGMEAHRPHRPPDHPGRGRMKNPCGLFLRYAGVFRRFPSFSN